MLELIRRFLETESIDYPILKEDLTLEISLQDINGQSSPKNQETICFEEKDLEHIDASIHPLESYYNNDAPDESVQSRKIRTGHCEITDK